MLVFPRQNCLGNMQERCSHGSLWALCPWELLRVWFVLLPPDIRAEGSLCHGRNANQLHRAGDSGLRETKLCLWGELSLSSWQQGGFLTNLHLSSNNKNRHTHTHAHNVSTHCMVKHKYTLTTHRYLDTDTQAYVHLSFNFRNESLWSHRCSYEVHMDVRGWEWVENILWQFQK